MKTLIYFNIFMFTSGCCQKRLDQQVRREVWIEAESLLRHINFSRINISDHLRNGLNEKYDQ